MYAFVFFAFLGLLITNLIMIQRSVQPSEELNVDETGFVQVKATSLSFSPLQTILLGVNFALFLGLVNYITLNRLNLRYFSFVFILILIFGAVLYLIREGLKDRVKISDSWFVLLGVLAGVLAVAYTLFGGRTYFHAEAYANLVTPTSSVFSADVDTVDENTLPVVDKAYGARLGALKLGEFSGLGSEFQVGQYSDILYQGEQYLVAPLEYRDIFKWLNNRETGTAGYILINKVTEETQLINLTAREGTGLKYVESAYFDQDLLRQTYFNGTTKYERIAVHFEIDEAMHPYFVVQLGLPTIFVNGGRDVVAIALVDAITGEVTIHETDEVPAFVDNVYNDRLVLEQLNYYGTLREGFLNSIFNQVGVLTPSPGTRTIMNSGELYHFTGLTSTGGDESTVGFVYVNLRTKESTLYSFSGATEYAAMNKSLTLIPQTNISSSFPVPVSIDEVSTYYLLIKGADGRIIRHVFMSVQDLQVFGIGFNQTSAYNDYLLNIDSDSNQALNTVSGEILAIDSYVLAGNTVYLISLEDGSYTLNVSNVSSLIINQLIQLNVGDTVTLQLAGNNITRINP